MKTIRSLVRQTCFMLPSAGILLTTRSFVGKVGHVCCYTARIADVTATFKSPGLTLKTPTSGLPAAVHALDVYQSLHGLVLI